LLQLTYRKKIKSTILLNFRFNPPCFTASPRNLPENQEMQVEEGQPLILSCPHETSIPKEISWSFSKSNVGISRRISQVIITITAFS